MSKIAVCIPTYMEEDTIEVITRKVDQGLKKIKCDSVVIVNCNN